MGGNIDEFVSERRNLGIQLRKIGLLRDFAFLEHHDCLK